MWRDKSRASQWFQFGAPASGLAPQRVPAGTGTAHRHTRLLGMTDASKNRDNDKQPGRDDKVPPAGAHDKPHLTDKHKTPGSGVLPDKDHPEIEGPTG